MNFPLGRQQEIGIRLRYILKRRSLRLRGIINGRGEGLVHVWLPFIGECVRTCPGAKPAVHVGLRRGGVLSDIT